MKENNKVQEYPYLLHTNIFQWQCFAADIETIITSVSIICTCYSQRSMWMLLFCFYLEFSEFPTYFPPCFRFVCASPRNVNLGMFNGLPITISSLLGLFWHLRTSNKHCVSCMQNPKSLVLVIRLLDEVVKGISQNNFSCAMSGIHCCTKTG